MKTVFFFGLLTMVIVFSSPVFAEQTGKELFEKSCKVCHGVDGKGNNKLAQGMKIDPKLLNLTKQETKSKKDEALKTVTINGVGKMKGFKDKLNPEEMSLIVAYLRTLK